MFFDAMVAKGNGIISAIAALAILSGIGLALSSVSGSPIRAQRLRRESDRFTLFLSEAVTRSTYSLEPILLSFSEDIVRFESPEISAQTFTPLRGVMLDIPGTSPKTPREVRHGRSCSPTSFLLTREGVPLQCTTTLSLRCRVRTVCSPRRRR